MPPVGKLMTMKTLQTSPAFCTGAPFALALSHGGGGGPCGSCLRGARVAYPRVALRPAGARWRRRVRTTPLVMTIERGRNNNSIDEDEANNDARTAVPELVDQEGANDRSNRTGGSTAAAAEEETGRRGEAVQNSESLSSSTRELDGLSPVAAVPPDAPALGDDDGPAPAVSQQSAPKTNEQQQQKKKKYSLRTRLREETEAPFRKARMFLYAGSAASAGVGAFISALRILSAAVGTAGVQPLEETVPNVAINLCVIGACAFLLRLEVRAGEKRLERMSRGARIGNLRIQDAATRQLISLKDARGTKRIVVVAGRADAVRAAIQDAHALRDQLEDSSLRVIPLVTEDIHGLDADQVARGWKFIPFAREEWKRWYEEERGIMGSRLKNQDDVLVIVIRLDGKVGARSVGTPIWSRLIEQVKRLPPKDQYGKP